MAAKKTTALATTPKAHTLAPLSAEMRAEAKAGVATFTTGSPRISFKGGRISIDKEPVKDNRLPIAIIDTVLAKAYYDKPYNPDAPSSPVCYAFSAEGPGGLQPHPASPQKQAENCKSCPLNQFGTATLGKGKACRDIVRAMGVVPSEDDFTGAEARSFDITGHSIKAWNDYVGKLKMIERSPLTVVTLLSTEPHGAAFRETFSHHDDLTQEQYASLKSRREAAREAMMQPYPAISDEEEAPKAAAPKKARKF